MKTIEGWFWFNNCRIRGFVEGASFATKAVVEVDAVKGVVTVQGGEVFLLGTPADHEEKTLEQLAEAVRLSRNVGKLCE